MLLCRSDLVRGSCIVLALCLLVYPVLSLTNDEWLENRYNDETKPVRGIDRIATGGDDAKPAGESVLPDIVVIHPEYKLSSRSDIYSGPCPVGTGNAPFLKDPGYVSRSLCRGACGEDCDKAHCDVYDALADPDLAEAEGYHLSLTDRSSYLVLIDTGYCEYPNTVVCKTHRGCREHDSCFDWCAQHGETGMTEPCHMRCNYACLTGYGFKDCLLWADLIGNYGYNPWQIIAERLNPTSYDARSMKFSDPPVYHDLQPDVLKGKKAQPDRDDTEIKMPTGDTSYKDDGGPITIGDFY